MRERARTYARAALQTNGVPMMSNEIKAAIRAVVAATKAELGTGKIHPELQRLTQKAIEAAEQAVGVDTGSARTRPKRQR